jgi:hypothetical protein
MRLKAEEMTTMFSFGCAECPERGGDDYVNLDLSARAAGVGADGLVGGVDPHPADAVGELIPLVQRHVEGLLHDEL